METSPSCTKAPKYSTLKKFSWQIPPINSYLTTEITGNFLRSLDNKNFSVSLPKSE